MVQLRQRIRRPLRYTTPAMAQPAFTTQLLGADVELLEWTAETSWIAFQLSGGGPAAAEHTSPSAVYNPSNGRTSVYYVATTGQLWTYSWSSETGWIAFQLSGGGPAAAAKTSPTTVYNQSNLRTSVYYVATTGQLWTYSWSSEKGLDRISTQRWRSRSRSRLKPTAVYNESSLATGVYYIASSGQLWELRVDVQHRVDSVRPDWWWPKCRCEHKPDRHIRTKQWTHGSVLRRP